MTDHSPPPVTPPPSPAPALPPKTGPPAHRQRIPARLVAESILQPRHRPRIYRRPLPNHLLEVALQRTWELALLREGITDVAFISSLYEAILVFSYSCDSGWIVGDYQFIGPLHRYSAAAFSEPRYTHARKDRAAAPGTAGTFYVCGRAPCPSSAGG